MNVELNTAEENSAAKIQYVKEVPECYDPTYPVEPDMAEEWQKSKVLIHADIESYNPVCNKQLQNRQIHNRDVTVYSMINKIWQSKL